jgi:hypothetical protein
MGDFVSDRAQIQCCSFISCLWHHINLEDLGIAQLSSVFSITGFHPAVQQKFRMIDATAGRGMFATVQSAVNLADLGMVQLSRVNSLTGSPYCTDKK